MQDLCLFPADQRNTFPTGRDAVSGRVLLPERFIAGPLSAALPSWMKNGQLTIDIKLVGAILIYFEKRSH